MGEESATASLINADELQGSCGSGRMGCAMKRASFKLILDGRRQYGYTGDQVGWDA